MDPAMSVSESNSETGETTVPTKSVPEKTDSAETQPPKCQPEPVKSMVFARICPCGFE